MVDIFQRLHGSPFLDWPTDSGEENGLSRLYDQTYFFSSWRYRLPDVDFECGMHDHDPGNPDSLA